MKAKAKKILFAVSECAPFVKTGGLADVAGALPNELARGGDEVCVMLPLYREISQEWRDKMSLKLHFYVELGWRRQYCGILEMKKDGVHYYFIDNEYYFNRSSIYGYGDEEGERFVFFCRAVLDALAELSYFPDIIHCHDWQTGMIPALLRMQYDGQPEYAAIATMYTIHNLQYQGVFPIDYIEDFLHLGARAYTGDKLEFFGCVSFMKAGIVYADHITTVSPSYAQEIQTAYYGERLDGLLRARAGQLDGVLNGIDQAVFNPATNPMLYKNFTGTTWQKGKAANKAALQEDLGLQVDPSIPIIGVVSRLSPQKGLDLVERVMDEIMGLGVQMVVLGKGDDRFSNFFSWAAWRYDGQFATRIEMNETLAHRIYAGSDMLLMPSRFEPCGLAQMIAMRYGTVPVARETGGLRDTVLAYNEETKQGNGFTFFQYNAHDMLHVIQQAVATYRDSPDVWKALVKRGMAGEYSWARAAKAYQEIYTKMLQERVPLGTPAPDVL